MNRLLKELAEQAGLEMCSCGCNMPTRQTAKFAELIVRECAKIVEGSSLPDAYSESCLVLIAEDIKEHFGVES